MTTQAERYKFKTQKSKEGPYFDSLKLIEKLLETKFPSLKNFSYRFIGRDKEKNCNKFQMTIVFREEALAKEAAGFLERRDVKSFLRQGTKRTICVDSDLSYIEMFRFVEPKKVEPKKEEKLPTSVSIKRKPKKRRKPTAKLRKKTIPKKEKIFPDTKLEDLFSVSGKWELTKLKLSRSPFAKGGDKVEKFGERVSGQQFYFNCWSREDAEELIGFLADMGHPRENLSLGEVDRSVVYLRFRSKSQKLVFIGDGK